MTTLTFSPLGVATRGELEYDVYGETTVRYWPAAPFEVDGIMYDLSRDCEQVYVRPMIVFKTDLGACRELRDPPEPCSCPVGKGRYQPLAKGEMCDDCWVYKGAVLGVLHEDHPEIHSQAMWRKASLLNRLGVRP